MVGVGKKLSVVVKQGLPRVQNSCLVTRRNLKPEVCSWQLLADIVLKTAGVVLEFDIA